MQVGSSGFKPSVQIWQMREIYLNLYTIVESFACNFTVHHDYL